MIEMNKNIEAKYKEILDDRMKWAKCDEASTRWCPTNPEQAKQNNEKYERALFHYFRVRNLYDLPDNLLQMRRNNDNVRRAMGGTV